MASQPKLGSSFREFYLFSKLCLKAYYVPGHVLSTGVEQGAE
jgi:hypothetical protein